MMEKTITFGKRKLFTCDYTILLFVAYMSLPFFVWAFGKLFDIAGIESHRMDILLTIMYIPTILVAIKYRKKALAEFLILLFIILVFFGITYLFHHEYKYVYFREEYGIWPYVFQPSNGLYVFLFIRMVNDYQKIYKGLRISGYIMYAYSAVRLFVAMSRGYWLEQNYLGQPIQLSYNLNFGYGLLIYVCFFFLVGMREKHLSDLILSWIGLAMILLGGSRGPLLGVAIFFALYVLLTMNETKYKLLYIVGIIICGLTMVFFYEAILLGIAHVMETFHVSSRTIMMLIEGSVSDNNGRSTIWEAAINMIKTHPLGYGAMGARHVIYKIHIVGHPHNFFLEILIDYGIVIGPILLIVVFGSAIKQFISKCNGEWRYVLLLFFANYCQLLTSFTYWHSTGLWALLAVLVCIREHNKNNVV